MSEKTLGQIAHEAKNAIDPNAWMTPDWENLPPVRQKLEEAAAQAVRRAVIEECAKVALDIAGQHDAAYESSFKIDPQKPDHSASAKSFTARRIVNRIRDLAND